MSTPAWFNKEYYLQSKLAQLVASGDNTYSDIVALDAAIELAGYTAYSHFQSFSLIERTSPNEFFNAGEYLTAKAAQANATAVDGRTDWTADFIALAIRDAGIATIWDHFAMYGWAENVNPSNAFDVSDYFADKLAQLQATDPAAGWTDASMKAAFAAAGLDPVTHYLSYGAAEGLAVTTVPADEQVAGSTPGGDSGQTFTLTTSQDTFVGTNGNDTFLGLDENSASDTVTLGDTINGGDGVDTLQIYADNDDLTLAPIAVDNVENLVVTNAQTDWDDFNVANRSFDYITLDVGGLESGGLDVYNINADTAVTMTNIEADDESNYITFDADATSAVGNTNVTVSNVDMSNDYEYFYVESTFTAADTVNVVTSLSDIDDQEEGYGSYYYQDLYTGTTTGVAVNATFNVENVLSSYYNEVELYVYQAGGSVNNVTVNLTNTDNVDVWMSLDEDGNGTSKTDVVTLNVSGVQNSDDESYFYTTDAETFNVNVLGESEFEAIGNYYNYDGSLMGATVVNLNAAADLKVGFWDFNDDAGVTENTTFTITGAGNVTIADLDDGSSNLTVDASTATGNISLKGLEAEVVSVTTNTGNDTVQVGGFETTVSTGSGDDKVDTNGYDFGDVDAAELDGGTGRNTIVINEGTLLTAAAAANISNFQVLDITGAALGDTFDMSVESSLDAVVAKGSLGAVVIDKAAAGTTVALTSASSVNSTVDSLTYALKTATGTSDNFELSLTASDTDKKANDKDGQLTVTAVVANAIETISVSSNATTTDGSLDGKKLFTATDYVNTIGSLSADAVKTLTLTGAADLTITAVTATTLSKVDASAMTGSLNITLGATATASVAVLGGSAADTITMTGNTAENNIIVGNGGADVITLALAGTKETVRYASDTDSVLTLKDTTVPAVTPVVFDTATGYDTITGFTSTGDKIELSSLLGLATGDARSAIAGLGSIGDVDAAADLQVLIGTGVDFFNDGAVDRAVATVTDGVDLMMFIDTNADGNFTNGTDQAIKLAGVTEILISDVIFG